MDGNGLGLLVLVAMIGGGAWFYFTNEDDRKFHLFLMWAVLGAGAIIVPTVQALWRALR